MENEYICKKLLRVLSLLVFIFILFYIMYTTVLSRETGGTFNYNFQLFWSYSQDSEVTHYNFWLNTRNVILFLPLGLLLPIAFSRIKWWTVFLIGLFYSVCIEVLQLVLKRGYCELDDVFHNTLGCILGYLIMKGIVSIIKEQ